RRNLGLQQVLPKQAKSRAARSTSNQQTRTKTKTITYVIKKAKQTTRRSKKAVTNAPVEDSWTRARGQLLSWSAVLFAWLS
ncbi:MAG: hypothetical protein ACKPKO_40510, partial [Candidatus Fonsibacter sp.]